jgi:diadenosine tetraphosphatase ApaH/serine/threonine PP2A family protein phosphatase
MIMNELDHPGRLYIIGDIHGRLDLLNRLIDRIGRDAQHYDGANVAVTLGDYVDRGPDSRGVINRLLNNPFPGEYVALKGNHEALFEKFLKEPDIGSYWRQLGGLETLHSFGVPVKPLMTGKKFEDAAEQLRSALSTDELKFLKSLKTSFAIDRFFMCHAGVRPGVPLDHQREEDLLWIRDDFLRSDADFGKIIVHGHTPIESPEFRPNRINIDTGAFATGRLTCLVVEAGKYRTMST